MKRVILVGGGTAGHVEPALAVGRWLQKKSSEIELGFIGTKSGIEVELLVDTGITFHPIVKVPFPRKIDLSIVLWPFKFLLGVWQSLSVVRKSDLVIGFGGYVSAPAYFAAWILRKPLIIHEANAKPGMANTLGTFLTREIFVAFSETKKSGHRWEGAVESGMPIKSELDAFDFSNLDKQRREFLKSVNLDNSNKTLLVFGGSLGSTQINQAIFATKKEILKFGWNIVHMIGASNELPGAEGNYRPVKYINNMASAYAAADFVICRAGAVTCAELLAVGVPALLVPLEIGNGEQQENAKVLIDKSQAQVVPNREFTKLWAEENLIDILKNAPARFAGISKRADETIGVRALDLIRLSRS